MQKEKVLEIEFIKVWDDYVWRIVINTLFQVKELKSKREIIYKNIKFYLNSSYSINIYDDFNDMYILVNHNELISKETKDQIEEFTNYINSTYGIPKRWRAQAGNLFYYITSDEDIESDYENFSDETMNMYTLGNYFQTKEEAQKVIDSKEWQEFWAKVRAGEIGGKK